MIKCWPSPWLSSRWYAAASARSYQRVRTDRSWKAAAPLHVVTFDRDRGESPEMLDFGADPSCDRVLERTPSRLWIGRGRPSQSKFDRPKAASSSSGRTSSRHVTHSGDVESTHPEQGCFGKFSAVAAVQWRVSVRHFLSSAAIGQHRAVDVKWEEKNPNLDWWEAASSRLDSTRNRCPG